MTTLWEIAFIALFLVVLAEAFAVLALARAIGALQLRFGGEPAALDTRDGLPVGSTVPLVGGLDLSKNRRGTFSVNAGRWLLIFVSPVCHYCRDIARDAGRVSQDRQSDATILLIARGTHEQNQVFKEVAPKTHVVSDSLGAVHDAYAVSRVPYAMLLEEGRVVAKGVTNTRDELELLLDERRSTKLAEGHEQWTTVGPAAPHEAEAISTN